MLPIGSGFAVWVGADSPLDKVVGVGMGSPFDDEELAAVEHGYAERGAPVQFEVSTLADLAVVERLTRRGYVLVGFENVLGLQLSAEREARIAEGVEIRDVGAEEFELWLDVDVEASLTPDSEGIAADEEFAREALERATPRLLSGERARPLDRVDWRRPCRGREHAALRWGGPDGRRRNVATVSATRCADVAAVDPSRRGGRSWVRPRRCHRAAGLEVAGERPTARFPAAVHTFHPYPSSVTARW